MKKVTRKRKLKPLVLQDGALLMRVGVVLDACCAGLHMLPETACVAGFRPGDYLLIDSDERCTQIVRKLVHCHVATGMRCDYVYLDPQSAHYLTCELHEKVTVKRAEYDMEMP